MKEINNGTVRLVCQIDMCNGCMACLDKCSVGAISIIDGLESYNAVINREKCVGCGMCESVCPRSNSATKLAPRKWHQGWAADAKVRAGGSSGGVASAIAYAFVNNGGMVCSCVFQNGEFVFDAVESAEDIFRFKGSKYVKSDPRGIYKKIKAAIQTKKKVLFIGLPCQSAAVQRYIGSSEYLYTVDLICHGTPSPKLLDAFLKESGYSMDTMTTVDFREKESWGVSCDGLRMTPRSVMDRYMMAFLYSVDYTENCYNCDYATVSRVSDITLGDSWGSSFSEEERKKGISLILSQTDKGDELLEAAGLQLFSVDSDVAIKNNRQLTEPSKKSLESARFFKRVKRKLNFKRSVFCVYPKYCLRQSVKKIMIKSIKRRENAL